MRLVQTDSKKHGTRKEEKEEEYSSDEIEEIQSSKPVKFRGRYQEHSTSAKFPTASTYKIGEEVWVLVAGQSRPAGPYLVKATMEDRKYRLVHKSNGQELASPVKEDDIVVPVP